MKRREFIIKSMQYFAGTMLVPQVVKDAITTAGAAVTPKPYIPPNPAIRRSNILLIVADDLGYSQIGVQGCQDIPTPQIDSIAQNGARFTDGYVSCPVCSPTRAGLITGRYQQRFGHEFNPGGAKAATAEFGLSLNETPLPARLKSLGYATGMFGKWHLGYKPEYHPLNRGFDEFYGFLGGAHAYLKSTDRTSGTILRGMNPTNDFEYTTDAFAREAVSFINRHQHQPFFVYLPFNAVHSPLQATAKYLQRFKGIKDPKRRTFAAMLSAMDDGIGAVLAQLRALNLEQNTLIFFISDNGGPTLQTTSQNTPLRGYKGNVLEGGIRVPFLMQWKSQIPAGTVYSHPAISLDIHPTAFAAAGGKITPEMKFDGVNLLPYLRGLDKSEPHQELFWRFGPQSAIRSGDWKLIQYDNGNPELYNLKQDISESNNLASKTPEKVKQLQQVYSAWNAELIPPKWAKEKKLRKQLLKPRLPRKRNQ